MLDKAYFDGLREANSQYIAARRKMIGSSDDARNASKRAIFALHRDDDDGAAALLKEAEERLDQVRKMADDHPGLLGEGAYKAGLEEYVEARLYRQFLTDGTVGPIEDREIPHEIYLAGLSDLTGELQRRQVRLATERDLEGVTQVRDAIEAIVEEMLKMDLSGYLRTKFDQAKNSLRRADDVRYEVSLRV